jgi:hypothetical protein
MENRSESRVMTSDFISLFSSVRALCSSNVTSLFPFQIINFLNYSSISLLVWMLACHCPYIWATLSIKVANLYSIYELEVHHTATLRIGTRVGELMTMKIMKSHLNSIVNTKKWKSQFSTHSTIALEIPSTSV